MMTTLYIALGFLGGFIIGGITTYRLVAWYQEADIWEKD